MKTIVITSGLWDKTKEKKYGKLSNLPNVSMNIEVTLDTDNPDIAIQLLKQKVNRTMIVKSITKLHEAFEKYKARIRVVHYVLYYLGHKNYVHCLRLRLWFIIIEYPKEMLPSIGKLIKKYGKTQVDKTIAKLIEMQMSDVPITPKKAEEFLLAVSFASPVLIRATVNLFYANFRYISFIVGLFMSMAKSIFNTLRPAKIKIIGTAAWEATKIGLIATGIWTAKKMYEHREEIFEYAKKLLLYSAVLYIIYQATIIIKEMRTESK